MRRRIRSGDVAEEGSCSPLERVHACLLAPSTLQLGIDERGNSKMKAFWEALYAAKADVVLNGHVHNYEHFFPQTPSGKKDLEQGIREFVVGTGGYSLNAFKISPLTNTKVRDAAPTES